jgi:diguanylate cyclase (GGDEF)-like protein
MGKNKTFKSFIASLHRRTPLTLKMIIITIALGLVMWAVFDWIQTNRLRDIFQEQLENRLREQANEDRLSFDRYVKAHLHSAKLFISQKNFSDYIERQKWFAGDSIKVKRHMKSPEWFPRASVLRTFAQPRYALLLDSRGRLREIYSRVTVEAMPEFLFSLSEQLILKSRGQNFITEKKGDPYLFASEQYKDSRGKIRAVLMLVSPLDDVFLSNVLGPSSAGHFVALLTQEEDPRILISSNLSILPVNTPLKSLENQFSITGEEFFDYGASEQAITFVSLVSKSEVRPLIKSVVSTERQLRSIALPVLIVSFALLMFWITQRIQWLTQHISEFSQRLLGTKHRDLPKGDQLFILEERFQSLTKEIIEAREALEAEANDKLQLQKKNMEVEQQEKQLVLLQSVTEDQSIGVIIDTPRGLRAANKQMESFADMYGGLSAFEIRNNKNEERSLVDKKGMSHIFNISVTKVLRDEKILLVRDITEFRAYTDNLERLALKDFLTELPNRKLFYDRLKQAILTGHRENKSFALFMLDVDSFKEINDTLGHYTGDVVLKEIGKRLMGVLRESDTVARIGGDEFAILLPGAGLNYSKQVASRLQNAMQEPCVIDNTKLFVRISIGIALYPEHGREADPLMRRADVAMYTAKKNQTAFSVYLAGKEGDSG